MRCRTVMRRQLPKLPAPADEVFANEFKLPPEFDDLSPRRRNAITAFVGEERKRASALSMKILVVCLNQYFGWGLDRLVRLARHWTKMGMAVNDDYEIRSGQLDDYLREIGLEPGEKGIYGYTSNAGKPVRRQTFLKWQEEFEKGER